MDRRNASEVAWILVSSLVIDFIRREHGIAPVQPRTANFGVQMATCPRRRQQQQQTTPDKARIGGRSKDAARHYKPSVLFFGFLYELD